MIRNRHKLFWWMCIVMCMFTLWSAWAWVSSSMQRKIDQVVERIIERYDNQSVSEQLQWVSPLVAKLRVVRNTLPSSKHDIVDALVDGLQKYVDELYDKVSDVDEGREYTSLLFPIQNIDTDKIKQTWLWWYNDVRASKWLWVYQYDARLGRTAQDRAQFLLERNRWQSPDYYGVHKRSLSDSYYNYAIIDQWFRDRGVNAKNINRITHSENVWWWYINCDFSVHDCTDELIASIRTTFDFFMSEESYNWAHYRSIVKSEFQYIGVWLVVEWTHYRIVIHYVTEIE